MLSRDGFKSEAGKRLWDEIFGIRNVVRRKKPSPVKRPSQVPAEPSEPSELPVEELPRLPSVPVRPAYAPPSPLKHTPVKNTQPSLHEIVRVSKYKGLVGAEREIACITLCGGNQNPFVVLGPSRGGKTFATDISMGLLGSNVCRIEFATESSLWNLCETLSQVGILYLPELQKSWRDPGVRDVCKGMLEGRDMTRTVTKGGKAVMQNIYAGASIAATMALENKGLDDLLLESPEMLARVAIINMASSPEHVKEVNEVEAYKRGSILDEESYEQQERNLKAHLQKVFSSDVSVINPFAAYLKELLPSTQKSMGYNKHFYDFVEAVTRFHQFDRSRAKIGAREYVIADLADCQYAYELFYDDFIGVSRILANEDEKPLFGQLPPIDLRQCLDTGYAQLDQGEGLKKLRVVQPCIAKRWYERQVVGGEVVAPNYATGLPEPILEGL